MELGGLTWEAWYTAAVIVGVILGLVREWARPELLLTGALAALLAAGVLAPAEALAGFANPAVAAVGALYIVAAGAHETGALSMLSGRLTGGAGASTSARLLRLLTPTTFLSGALNNTPVVAMLIPQVQQRAQQGGFSASKLLLPLSYASIAGGMTTLIGTSTNLVVDGLLRAEGHAGLAFFDLTWVGLPVALVVLAYLVAVAPHLLPDRETPSGGAPADHEEPSDYLFEVEVASGAPFAGTTIEEAELRALGDAYLVHLRRRGKVVPVSPDAVLEAGDVLAFVGRFSMLRRLLQRPGFRRTLPPAPDEEVTLPLYEAVVAPTSGLVGKTLREADFRTQYRGTVLAIQRRDERVAGALGRTPLKPGDLLLVEAPGGFDAQWNARRDEFYLVAQLRAMEGGDGRRRAPVALALLAGMIALVATGVLPLLTAALLAALGMMASRCLSVEEARSAVNVSVLVVIAAAFGLGRAVEQTGLAPALADALLGAAAAGGPIAVIAALYLATNVLTELITNNAAAVLMLPVALSAAGQAGIGTEAAAVTVAIAASASFVSPIGYHTNLMVMAAGGYRASDYARLGLPLSLLVMACAVGMIYVVWL